MVEKNQAETKEYLLERIQDLEAKLEATKNEKLAMTHELEKLRTASPLIGAKDELTGLLNRKGIFAKLEEEMARAERFDNPLTILLLDIDDFDEINEKHGKAYGDEVLAMLAQVFRDATRTFDFIGRYGGEEFLLIFPETKLDAGYEVAERIRKTASTTLFKFGTHVRISGGVKTYYAEDIVKLVREADTALDLAKSLGKNQIVISDK